MAGETNDVKKSLLLLTLVGSLFMQGCATHRINTRDSFVQVLKTVELAGCGTDRNNKEIKKCATFAKMSGVGSGVIVWNERSIGGKPRTLVLTADHVCHAENRLTQDVLPKHVLDGFKNSNGIEGDVTFNIAEIVISLKDSRGTQFKTESQPVLRHVDADICILESSINQPAIDVARAEPEFGEKIVNISAPYGLMFANPGGGAVYITEGLFSGNFLDGFNSKSMYTIWTAPGSSGSPLLNDRGEIVGMVSAISTLTWPRLSPPMVGVSSAPSNITFGPTLSQLQYSVSEAVAALKRGKPFIYSAKPSEAKAGAETQGSPEAEQYITPFILEWTLDE